MSFRTRHFQHPAFGAPSSIFTCTTLHSPPSLPKNPWWIQMRVQVCCRWITVAIIVVYPVVVAAAAGTVNFLHAMRHCLSGFMIFPFAPVRGCFWSVMKLQDGRDEDESRGVVLCCRHLTGGWWCSQQNSGIGRFSTMVRNYFSRGWCPVMCDGVQRE